MPKFSGDFQKEIREISVRSWPGLTDLALGQGKMKCLLKLSSSLVFHFSTYKILLNNCDVFLCCVPSRSSWESVCPLCRKLPFKPLNTWAGCHPFWLRLSERRWVSHSPKRFPASRDVLGCGELLREWETFVCFTDTTKKATLGGNNYGVFEWVRFMINNIDWGSSQRSKYKMKGSISYYQPPNPNAPTLTGTLWKHIEFNYFA